MRRFLCFALSAGLFASPALAQSSTGGSTLPSAEDLAKRDTVTVGAGGAWIPDYEGSNDYHFMPVGALRGRISGISFSSRGSYLYVNLLPQRAKFDFNVGPVVGARFNGRRHIDDPVVRLLPETKTAIEAGAFVGVSAHGLTNPYDTLAFRVDALHDISGTHRSTVISPSVEFSTPLSERTFASLSVSAEFVSNKFADYYYSVTPAGSVASGLPVYVADGGMKSWKSGLLLNQSLTGNLLHGLSIFGYGEYARLVGDFKRSPIVAQRGSASQWTGAVGLAYTW